MATLFSRNVIANNLNTLELDIKTEDKENYLVVKIDGEDFLNKIAPDNTQASFFPALLESSNKNGDFLIFTCSCGIADCGGWELIKVKHNNQETTWTFNYEKDFQFSFDTEMYKGEIKRLEFELKNKNITLQPEHVIEPE
tara:strand:- start:44 stop:463 length:420 start_codon:yes stop_codon:yes gene_type:complete